MGDYHEYEIIVIIRDKETGGIYGDIQQNEYVRTIVRDESFDWNDNIDTVVEKLRNLIESTTFSTNDMRIKQRRKK